MLTALMATKFEAAPFIEDMKEVAENVYEGTFRIIISETGLVNMATSTAFAITEFRPKMMVNLGIAGAVSTTLTPGQVLRATRFSIFSTAEIPESSQSIWEGSYPDLDQGEGASLFTSLHPVWNEQDRKKLTALGADLVDMEGYAFAKTCQDHGINFEVIKAVSDNLQKKSQDDFLRNAGNAIESLHAYFTAKTSDDPKSAESWALNLINS